MTQIRPITNNVVSSQLTGELILDYTTGNNEYLDLFKSHIALNFTTASQTPEVRLDSLGACLFDRGQLFLNGVRVCSSNNYTEDSLYHKRIMFSSDYNKKHNDVLYEADGAAASSTYADGTHCVIEHLDGLFLRTPDLIVPPNTNIRISFNCAPASGLYKSVLGDGTDSAITYTVNDIWMNAFIVSKDEQVEDEFPLRFVTSESFKSSISSASLNIQYSLKENLVRLGAVFQSTGAYDTSLGAADKYYNAPHFTYTTDGNSVGTPEAMQLYTLYMKAGSMQIPSTPLDNTTYGFRQSFQQMMEAREATLDPNGGETLEEWLNQGPIYSFPIVKSIADTSKTCELVATFKGTPTAWAYLFATYENFVMIKYANGVPISTTTSI